MSSIAKKVQGMMTELVEKTGELEKKCQQYAGQNDQLTKEIATSREEVRKMLKELEKVKRENMKLNQRLLAYEKEEEEEDAKGNAVESHLKKEAVTVKKNGSPMRMRRDNGRSPYFVFPEEVWIIIFGNLKEPKDLKSCYETCRGFQSMLQEQRKNFLFDDVLKIMSEKTPPLTASISSCRLVCYGWKQCVDTFLQAEASKFPEVPRSRYDPPPVPAMNFTSRLKNPWNNSDLRNLNQEMNPVPSRYVRYSDHKISFNEEERRQRRNDFTSFLRKFGSHIWFFELSFHEKTSKEDSIFCYPAICEWLGLMPNLKMVYLRKPMFEWWMPDHHGYYNGYDHYDDDEYDSNPTTEKRLEWLKKQIAENPCPTVNSLETIYFEESPPAIIQAVLVTNPQVRKLKIEQNEFGGQGLTRLSLNLGMLEELVLPHRGSYVLSQLDYSMSTPWNLRKLTLQSGWCDWSGLFENIGTCFGETLEELDLALNGPDKANCLRLRLPKLKRLNLKITRCHNSIDFILPMVNLEYLTADLTFVHQMSAGNREEFANEGEFKKLTGILEVVKFLNMIGDLKKSSIWQILPKLKQVTARREDSEEDFNDDYGGPAVELNVSKWYTCTRDEVELK